MVIIITNPPTWRGSYEGSPQNVLDLLAIIAADTDCDFEFDTNNDPEEMRELYLLNKEMLDIRN